MRSYDWVNSINGIRYKDDATIMAWNLANEARCQNCKPSAMQKWWGPRALL
jgi:mannan endo-1,4-beta-mannosidase